MSREFPTRPYIGVGVIVLRAGEVLLVRRARPPAVGAWSLPGGAQELGETLEEAARRELFEETALRVEDLHFVGHVDAIHRDADDRIRFHYTILDFAGLWRGGEPVAGDDVDGAGFFAPDSAQFAALAPQARRLIERARLLLGKSASS
jgi:8-oxo-dGTP diphosphatase